MFPRAKYARSSLLHMQGVTPSLTFTHGRALHTTPPSSREGMNKTRQGHAANPKNLHPQDVESQSVRAGFQAKKDEKNEGEDAAKRSTIGGKGERPSDVGKGNPEGVGFVEQVGSTGATARKFEAEEKK